MNAQHLPLVLLLASTFLTAGCAQLDAFERSLEAAGVARFGGSDAPGGAAVRIRAGERAGRGAVVAPDRVLTVAHVVGDAEAVWVDVSRSGAWVEARVVDRLPSSPEDLLLLELSTDAGWAGALFGFAGFSAGHVHAAAPGAAPAWIETARGRAPVSAAPDLRPGDSGSPVLDRRLRLVGLLSGRSVTAPRVAGLPTAPTVAASAARTPLTPPVLRTAPASPLEVERGRRGRPAATLLAAAPRAERP